MASDKFRRRDFIRLVISGAGLLSAGALLQACGGSAAPASSAARSSAPASPTASSAASKPAASSAAPTSGSAVAKPAGSIGTGGPPEKASIKVGLPSTGGSHTFLPVYLSSEQTAKPEGLSVQVVEFNGNGPVSQALASGAIDLSLSGVNGLVSAILAKQPIVGFYAGFWQAFFDWISVPSVKTWDDMKGKIMAVTTPGSLTDVLTHYVIQKHGINPKDVNFVNGGGAVAELQALKANRIGAAIMQVPQNWQALDAGMHLLGTQKQEVAPTWPQHAYITTDKFLNGSPNTVRAFLRSHVAAIRLAKAKPDVGIATLVKYQKISQDLAKRAYDDVMPGFDERGRLPQDSMKIFWDITIQTGAAKAPIPDSQLMDSRYVDTFDQWAPK